MPISPSLDFARPGGAPIADLLSAFHGLAYGGLTPAAPVPVHAPRECAQRLAGFFGRPDAGFLADTFDFQPLDDGHTVRHGGLLLTSRAVVHDVEAYGLRATCEGDGEGRRLAYSGDSGPCAALTGLAHDADLFLCEADIDRHREGEQVHLTPEDVGRTAREAGVGQLLITHVGPTLTPESATARAASVFGGPTATARVGETGRSDATPTSFAGSIDETREPSLGSSRRTSYVIYETRYVRSDPRSCDP